MFPEKVAEGFWLETLSLCVGQLDFLSVLKRNVHDGSGESVSVRVDIPQQVKDSLERSTRNHEVGIFVVLITAVQAVMYRYTGNEMTLIGTSAFDESCAEALLFVLNQIDPQDSFRTIIGQNREKAVEISRYQRYQLASLSEKFVAQFGNYEAIFDIGVAYEKLGNPSSVLASFKVQVMLRQDESGWHLEVTGKDGLVAEEDLAGFGRHIVNVLAEGFAEPGRLIRDFAILEAAEQDLVLNDFGQGQKQPVSDSLIDLFMAHVKAHPDNTAVSYQKLSLTYQELDAKSNQMARILQRAGVQSQDRVLTLLDKSVYVPISLLAILKTNSIYVPVDPNFPSDRILEMIEDCAPQCIITVERVLEKIPFKRLSDHYRQGETPREVILVEDLEYLCTEEDDSDLAHRGRLRDLVYILYTSGTTGTMKGVAVKQDSLVNLVQWFTSTYELGPQTRILQLTPLTFDPSVEQMWGALTSGAQVHLASHAELADVDSFITALEQRQTSLFNATPSILKDLLVDREKVKSVEIIISGGDVLSDELKDQLVAKGYQVFNQYGPTEYTVDATWSECQPQKPVSIGCPIHNTQVYILNRNLQPLPVGVVGELYMGGTGLAQGYWNDVTLTARKFVPSPFALNERLFRTGDRVRWNRQGEIEFVGRDDGSVKVHGVRINPGEVERALLGHARVQEAVVVQQHNSLGEVELCAYVQAHGKTEVQLKDYLWQRLPLYMIPSRIVLLDALPRLKSGKIDRVSLREQAIYELQGQAFREPVSDTEIALARIWSQALKVEKVGADIDFFALGGHSLLATRVLYHVYEEFGVNIDLREFFEFRTVELLSQRIEDKLLETADSEDLAAFDLEIT